jgi:DNA-binding NtrC family response regulator
MRRILIADDEPSMRRILATVLRDDGADVVEAGTVADALACLRRERLDAAIVDQQFPDGTGSQILAAALELDATLPVIVITAFATVELAVEVMRAGAFDFLPKPFHPEAVKACLRRASERSRLTRENRLLRAEVLERAGGDIVGQSPAMEAVRKQIAQVAPTNASVLILGETGTGKELVARAIHRASRRAGEPFIAINCAAMPEALLESQLFGHEKGSFTGADRAREGLFEAADGGTLFLDEAGEMSLGLQAKLLRVLNDGVVTRVGATGGRRCDVRVIAATNRDLARGIIDAKFREDLYYRLSVFPIKLPPLRERLDDLEPIALHLLASIAVDLAVPLRRLSPEVLMVFRRHDWPGNIRELRNVLERATIVTDGDRIEPEDIHLPPAPTVPVSLKSDHSFASSRTLKEALVDLECRMINDALETAGGVQAEAARRLGVSRSDLLYKIRRLGIVIPERRATD